MKRINTLKGLLFAALVGASGAASAQVHALGFGTVGGAYGKTNWYGDYVGLRFQVTAPSVIAGDKANIEATIGTATSDWPNIVFPAPLINVPIAMFPTTTTPADSFGGSIHPGTMTGKICVLWRGPIGTPLTFTEKAYNAQQSGAVACVIINEYPGGLPVGPGYSTGVGTVTIPVFVIGNYDGIAIENQYNTLPPNTVTMTITPWGQNLGNDLGFVQSGGSGLHASAMPYEQFFATGNPVPYMGVDGAYVANYGTNDRTNVTLNSTLTFTPNGGSASTIHTSSVTMGATVFPSCTTVPQDASADSIWALFAAPYNLGLTGTAGKGRFDLTYSLTGSGTEDYTGDNTMTMSYYADDSVYSKGQYDFAGQQPVRSVYNSTLSATGTATDFLWGPMYYVAKGGASISTVQFSLSSNTPGPLSAAPVNVFVFKWTDGTGGAADSIVENGELTLVSQGIYTFNGTSDTSDVTFNTRMGDPTTGAVVNPILLTDNSWYYVAVETPANFFLGADGTLNPLPRIYGFASSGYAEYNNINWAGDYVGATNPLSSSLTAQNNFCAFSVAAHIDSFNFGGLKGLIPAVAMIVNKTPPDVSHVAVKNVTPVIMATLSPNPAKDVLTVSVDFAKPTSTVRYTIIDGLARFVSKVEVNTNNGMNDTHTINTSNLAPGNYYLSIDANGSVISRPFTIVK